DSVAHIGHREVHMLRNTGSELLRVLVSTPLLIRSERALGYHSYQQPADTQKAAAATPATTEMAPRPGRPSKLEETRPPAEVSHEAPVAPADGRTASEAAEQEPPPPLDISGLVKKASEVAAGPKPERRKPLPIPEPEPVAP